MLLNNSHWGMPITENPVLGSVEIWELMNFTDDSHPIHLHMVRFQILDRRSFDPVYYTEVGFSTSVPRCRRRPAKWDGKIRCKRIPGWSRESSCASRAIWAATSGIATSSNMKTTNDAPLRFARALERAEVACP